MKFVRVKYTYNKKTIPITLKIAIQKDLLLFFIIRENKNAFFPLTKVAPGTV